MSNSESILHALPEALLSLFAVLAFLLAAFDRRWRLGLLYPLWALVGTAGALALVWLGPACREMGCPLFWGLMADDNLARFFRSLVLLATMVGIFISLGHRTLPAKRNAEYYALLLVLALGMVMLCSANNLLFIYLAMEAVSLSSYLLTAWENENRLRSGEAAMKYVLYGAVASGVMLFGMSLIYGLLGGLNLQQMNLMLANDNQLAQPTSAWALACGLVLVLAGFGYKIAAAPFHMWCPDAYEGAPTPFSALLSVGPKAAGFAVLLRFFSGLLMQPSSATVELEAVRQIPWTLVLGIISALSMTVGNLSALVQNNLKRLLAYSSIAHAGYVLMGVTAGGELGFQSVMIYLAVYLFMNLGAFAVVAAVEQKTGSEQIEVYRGLGKRSPLLALAMAVFLVSLTGLPPTAGFVGKLYLFAALLEQGGVGFWTLALIGIINSVISLFYYARVLRAMYLEKSQLQEKEPSMLGAAAVSATVLALPVLILGVFWHPLAELASWSAVFFH